MALTVSNSGELLLLTWSLKSTSTPEDLYLRLYSNAYVPVATSTAGSFTEATFSGYTSGGKSLTRSGWGSAATDSDGAALITYGTPQTWSATSSQVIRGYYIVGATSGTLVWAEAFSTPRSLVSGNDLTITPSLTLSSA